MKEYKIGIIEDTTYDLKALKRTMFANKGDNIVNFKDYDISDTKITEDEIVEEIKNDILDNNIMLLIIDNKLIIKDNKLKGTTIYEKVKEIIRNFPIVIMTNYKDEAYDNKYVDPDKIYDKEYFFKNGEYSKEKIKSMFLCIDRYNDLKNNIIAEKERLVREYENSSSDKSQETIDELLKVESEMKDYTLSNMSYLEELISGEKVREVIELLDELNSKLD